jgi:hypothetical protein
MPDDVDIVSIVAGGWSAKGLDFNRLPGLTIGVNDAALLAGCDIALSMDRLWTEGRWPRLKERGGLAHIRRNALQNIDERPPWLTVFECDHLAAVMALEPGRLNGTSSGLCALNLAFRFNPRRLILFGFDMQAGPRGEPHWYPPYPWSLNGATTPGKFVRWQQDFALAAAAFRRARIEVVNASTRTALRCFPTCDPREMLA